jgi:hypothetical protein
MLSSQAMNLAIRPKPESMVILRYCGNVSRSEQVSGGSTQEDAIQSQILECSIY